MNPRPRVEECCSGRVSSRTKGVVVPTDRFSAAVGSSPLDIGVGLTGGGRIGGRINLDDIVGLFADVGPMIQFVSFPHENGGPRRDVWHYQFVLRVGGSFGLRG